MPDAIGAADMYRLTDVGSVGAFARVTRAGEIVLARIRECSGMRRRWISELAAREGEPNHPAMLVTNRQSRQLDRHLGRHVSQSANDHAPHGATIAFGALQPTERRLDRLSQREPVPNVEHRRIP